MTFVKTGLLAGLVVCAGVAVAVGQTATDPAIAARQAGMKAIGANVKVLGDMAGGKVAFDAAAAAAAKSALIEAATAVPVAFEPSVTDATSKAKPEIWTGWDDFVAEANGLVSAAEAVDAGSLDGVKAGMGAIGGACKDCHTAFRL